MNQCLFLNISLGTKEIIKKDSSLLSFNLTNTNFSNIKTNLIIFNSYNKNILINNVCFSEIQSTNIIQFGQDQNILINFLKIYNCNESSQSDISFISGIEKEIILIDICLSMNKINEESIGYHFENNNTITLKNCCLSRSNDKWFSGNGIINSFDIINSSNCKDIVPFKLINYKLIDIYERIFIIEKDMDYLFH